MKRLVLTIAIGDAHKRIHAVTAPTQRAYAERLGADYLVLKELGPDQTTPHWEKLRIHELLLQYERIVYLDADVLVRDDCPDLFAEVPETQLGAHNEGAFLDRRASLAQALEESGETVEDWDGAYYNTGVMVISRRHRGLFRPVARQISNFFEQGLLNARIAGAHVPCHDLRYKLNRMQHMDALTGEQRHDAWLIHYAGLEASLVPQVAADDLTTWAAAAPEYKFPRHIHIDVQGGLGDQVDAEPTIRFLLEEVYPGDDVRVTTHFPRLFEHLTVPVGEHGKLAGEPGCSYRRFVTLPGPETPMWQIVSNLLCHTVDYCAMAVLRRTLPMRAREIRLTYSDEDLAEAQGVVGERQLRDLVLIHAGRHWPSKTFPVEWWQKVADGILAAGLTPCLIGQDDDEGTRGVLPVICREGMVDIRNLLSLGALIALIGEGQVLVSNDSAPVHIAGAFDNYIILIPTCKHPDHILPYRQGSVAYASAALYRKLTIDTVSSQPTEIYPTTADLVQGDIREYLPEAGDVVRQAITFTRR